MHLTEIAFYTRKAIIFAIVGFVLLIILRIVFVFVVSRLSKPPPPPPPTVTFGKLPEINLPPEGRKYNLNFQLVTKEFGLPVTPDRMEVFFAPQRLPSLLSSDRAKNFAAQLDFNDPPEELSPSDFRFTDTKLPARTLEYNSVTGNFHLYFDLLNDPSAASPSPLLTKEVGLNAARLFMEKNNQSYGNFDPAKTQIQFLSFDGQSLRETNDPNTVSAVRANFFLRDINKTPIVTSGYITSPTFVIVSAALEETKKYLEARVSYFQINDKSAATYPLKTSDQAWSELTSSQGYIAHFPKQLDKDVLIRHVYLAYFDADDYQPYLQPVFVFEGDDDFVGYVPGILPEWIGTDEPTTTSPAPM